NGLQRSEMIYAVLSPAAAALRPAKQALLNVAANRAGLLLEPFSELRQCKPPRQCNESNTPCRDVKLILPPRKGSPLRGPKLVDPSGAPPSLRLAQRRQWIHASCPARRQITCQQRYRRQHQCRRCDADRI